MSVDLDCPQPVEPMLRGRIRVRPEHFVVEELPGWSASGSGEHLLLEVVQCGANSAWVAAQLARVGGVPERDLGYCGLKDRHALTRQWYSLRDPDGAGSDRERALVDAEGEGWRVTAAVRHQRKLRRGDHAGNRFRLRLTELELTAGRDLVEQRLRGLAEGGVANYFGRQRFGREHGNLERVQRWVAGERLPRRGPHRSLLLSSARAHLFNRVLALRVRRDCWDRALPGDPADDGVPSGPLWGRGRSPASDQALALEMEALAPYAAWCEALEHAGLVQQRRPLVLRPRALTWCWRDADLELAFELPPGAYATVVVDALGPCSGRPERSGTEET